MKDGKKWVVLSQLKTKNKKQKTEELMQILLQNRGLKTKKEQEAFLHPDIATVTPTSVGIDSQQQEKTLQRIRTAIEKKEEIVVFGDYDVDGIAGTAILWETLHALGAKVMPYIPHRVEEGYGLSVKGIDNIKQKTENLKNVSLIITVDNGIVAHEAVEYANSLGIDVIITDHHVPSSILPKADAIFHSTKLCGTGVAWLLSKEINARFSTNGDEARIVKRTTSNDTGFDSDKPYSDHLALVALATVADLVPLQNANRVVLTEGLKILHTTKRPGIMALCQEAGIDQKTIGVYEIGHMLAPRINAMGRISSAMDSLRLLCTKDRLKAKVLAEKLGITNKDRQDLTKNLSEFAIVSAKSKGERGKNLLFLAHESYDEGVIGLVAGKLVEVYYRPSIVIAIGEKISKASARSVAGFNIIEFIRKAEHLLINAGGHPMAAGFTIATEKIAALEEFFLATVEGLLSEELLVRTLKIDCELSLENVSQELYDAVQALQPFGMGNPEPTFLAKAKVISARQVGKDNQHLKLKITKPKSQITSMAQSSKNKNLELGAWSLGFDAIAFGIGDRVSEFPTGKEVDIVYTIDEHEWNNKKSLQLKIRDIKPKN